MYSNSVHILNKLDLKTHHAWETGTFSFKLQESISLFNESLGTNSNKHLPKIKQTPPKELTVRLY